MSRIDRDCCCFCASFRITFCVVAEAFRHQPTNRHHVENISTRNKKVSSATKKRLARSIFNQISLFFHSLRKHSKKQQAASSTRAKSRKRLNIWDHQIVIIRTYVAAAAAAVISMYH